MVVQQADVGRSFVPFDNARVASLDPRGDAQRFGRHGGWQVGFRRGGSVETNGPLVITSRVDAFEDEGGARRDLDLYRKAMPGGGPSLPAPLGRESVSSTRLQKLGANQSRYYMIAWRDGPITASIQIGGFDGRVTVAQAERLARRQQSRVRRALR